MTPEQKRIAIAEACGWRCVAPFKEAFACWVRPGGEDHQTEWIPNYLTDLNEMHEAEKVLSIRAVERGGVSQRLSYRMHLQHICTTFDRFGEEIAVRDPIFATAAQRADAFLLTLGLLKP